MIGYWQSVSIGLQFSVALITDLIDYWALGTKFFFASWIPDPQLS